MHLYMDSNNYSVWPRQFGPGCAVCGAASTCGTVCGNPACICMPTDNKYTDLVPDFLPAVPVPPLTGAFYIYENAGDRYPDVDETFAGVNIRINGISHEDSLTYFAILDEIIDDSDGQDTGKLRRKDDNDRICYLISPGEDEY
ncbi:hypothetical protein HQ544_01525 [Candidatus Falkowbacteria bacterium]|nr:hypothetical protein [Candidatus Falkowbacteria bacterium]